MPGFETGVPDPIDVHVGRRVRLRRKELDMSQERLAEQLGLTFQQVQKYERGANRISASKLYRIAQVLSVHVAFFFNGLDDPASPESERYQTVWSGLVEQLLAEPNGAMLAQAFLSIRRRGIRKGIVDLARTVAELDQSGEEPPPLRSAAE
jgi:transcriptional regulator with XRE-family HTH domain